jgi:hypothetical protein
MIRAIQRREAHQKDVGWDLDQEISDKEDACAKAKGHIRHAQGFAHLNMGEADIDAIQEGHEIAEHQERHQPPHDLADRPRLQLRHELTRLPQYFLLSVLPAPPLCKGYIQRCCCRKPPGMPPDERDTARGAGFSILPSVAQTLVNPILGLTPWRRPGAKHLTMTTL